MEYSEERKEYNNVNTSIVSVYLNYDACFREIDKLYDEIDRCDEGYDFIKLQEILKKLVGFEEWEKLVKKRPLKRQRKFKESQDTVNIKKIISELESIISSRKLNYSELCQKMIILQTMIRGFFEYDIGFITQTDCIIIINKILKKVIEQKEADIINEKKEYFEAISYLKELVSDITLAVKILDPLMRWDYGTEKFAYLSSKQQLSVLLNQAIVLDRMYICLYKLEVVLVRLQKIINSFCVLSNKVLYVAGLLNFKIHKYTNAIECFERIDKKNSSTLNETELFHTTLLHAYCYEYNTKPEKAIGILCGPVKDINSWLRENKDEDIDKKLIIFKEKCKDYPSLFTQFFEAKSFNQQLEEIFKTDKDKFEKMVEILHALSHCINEYAILNINNQRNRERTKNDDSSDNKIDYPLMLSFARELMCFIAKHKVEYYTCYATIHGEYTDYDEAILLIDKAKEEVPNRETLKAEIAFFKYYFSSLINISADEERNIFNIYAQKYADDDAKCHFNIFEFRKALRNFYPILINTPNEISNDDEITKQYQSLEESYQKLCQMSPSLYMNANVRAELRAMQRAFTFIDKLYKIMLDGNLKDQDVTELLNEWNRFNSVKSEFDLNNTEKITQGKEDALKTSVLDWLYNEENGIVKSLYVSSSIFILAPISGVVVYQYQTGKIDTLFFENDITSGREYHNSIDIAKIRKEYASHKKWTSLRIPKLNWDKIPEVKAYFYWRDNVPNELLCAYSDTKQSIARQIKDEENFKKTINEAINQFKKDKNEYACKSHKNCCFIEVKTLVELEIIKDMNKRFNEPLFYYLLYTGEEVIQIIITNNEIKKCVETVDKTKQKIHEYFRNVKPKSIIDIQRNISSKPIVEKIKNDDLSFDDVDRLVQICDDNITTFQKIIEETGEDSDTGKEYIIKRKETENIRSLLNKIKNDYKIQEQINRECKKLETEIDKIAGKE